MIFSAPIFLYLVPLAGLPIVFHLILKQKKRTVVFSTLMFFHRTDPKLNSHRKIRQWLLLMMRILLIAFILLALSRPEFVTSMGLGGKISVVAIVDNSASMSEAGSYDNDRSKLECAREGARKLLLALESDSKAAVILSVDEPAVPAADSLTSDTELLLDSLDKIRPTAATGNAGNALSRAFELLRSSSTGGGAVHVFSDMQQSEWTSANSVEAGRDLAQANAGGTPITVYFHKVESEIREEANVAIASVQFPEEKVLPKHPYKIGLVLQNNSDIVANIRVNSIDNQGQKNTENIVVEGGRARTVEVETTPDVTGYHWIKAWIEGDGFSADNEAGIGVFCEETATVLFGGTPEEFGVLPVALSPSGQGQFTGMVVKFSLPGQLSQTAAKEKPILIVTTWAGMQSTPADSAWLREYVENGGNLLVVPSVRPEQRALSGQFPDWLGAGIKAREVYARGAGLEVLSEEISFWNRIREATGNSKLESISAYVFYPLIISAEFTPLLGVPQQLSADGRRGPLGGDRSPASGSIGAGKVVIAHKKLNRGNIYVSGTAFTSRWNTLPSSGLLVMIAQRMAVAGSSSGQEGAISLVAGERPRGIRAQGGEVEVLSLVGDSMDWKGKEQQIPAFPRTGVYLITAGDNKYCISVRASEKEGLEKYIEGSEVPALGQIAHQILPYDEAVDFEQYHKGQARSVELFLFLLLLATLALLAEGWLEAPRLSRAGQKKMPKAETVSEVSESNKGRLWSPVHRLRNIIGKSTHDTPVLSGEGKNGGRAS
ncbi:MAG TPA: BatA and WFA domain-containing protein [Sedimentisphaerales bacterium]|nr:BatA and WFA domain-containing protein [Sedimentisphaerales bacterium]